MKNTMPDAFTTCADDALRAGANAALRRCLRPAALAAMALGALLCSGCTNLTGLIDAHDQFGCGAPGKANCSTLSQTYERAHAEEETKALARDRALLAAENDAVSTKEVARPENGKTAAAAGTASDNRRGASVLEALAADRALHARRINEGVRASSVRRGLPARSPERVVMLWVLPWVDEEGDLHSASRVWVRVKDADWRIERVRSRAMQSDRPAVEP